MFEIRTSEIIFTQEGSYKNEYTLDIYMSDYQITLWFLDYKDIHRIRADIKTEKFVKIEPKDNVIKINQVEQTVL